MEIRYGTTAQHVLEEDYDENYDPTEEGEPKTPQLFIASFLARLLWSQYTLAPPNTQRYWNTPR